MVLQMRSSVLPRHPGRSMPHGPELWHCTTNRMPQSFYNAEELTHNLSNKEDVLLV